jgi:hypothetical protein
MTRIRWTLGAWLTVAAVALPVSAAAQIEIRVDQDSWGRPVFRLGQEFVLKAGAEVREAVVIFGDATIDGHVDQDVVVVLGKAQLGSTAVVEGNLVVVGGSATIASGAQVGRDLVVVASAYDAPPGFSPGGQHIVIGANIFGGRLEALVPWITRGLLWGRLIVPALPWVWRIVGLSFLVYLILNLIFPEPIRACVRTFDDRPLTAFAVGLLVMLLTGPVCVLLAVSVVGLAVVPFVIAALFIGGILGKIAVARWIGMGIVRQDSDESRPQSLRSFAIGFAVICFAYAIPILGFITWTLIGVFGLGTAALTFISAYRRENPAPPPRLAPLTPPSIPPPPTPSPTVSPPPALAPQAQYRRSATSITGGGRRPCTRRNTARGIAPHRSRLVSARSLCRSACRVRSRRHPGRDRSTGAGHQPARSRQCRVPAPARVSHRLLDVETDHGRRHHLPAARRAHRWSAAVVRRCAGARSVRHFLARGVRLGVSVDSAGPRAAGLARQDCRHLRGQSTEELSAVMAEI